MALVSMHNQRITGTTANAYPATAQYENDRIGTMNGKSVMIQNTGSSNSLDFKIEILHNKNSTVVAYPLDGGGATELTVVKDEYALINIPEVFYKVSISAKSTITDNTTTFEISMTGRSNL